jgi:hypothetical protein
MARVVGDIAVKVGADIGPLQQGMRNAGRSVDDFDSKTQKMAINVAKAGAAVVTAVAAIAGGVLKMASEAAKAGVEIQNLSQVANTNTTTFQRMADASRTVGIEQQKLADILKDVNDKVGDFIVTGGGPMADFFENIAPLVGVTADEFARLSGPDALQLYVSSLEKAGVNQQQMTFYMEALASDATALLPLLRNNGLEMNRLGDEAERAGRILSEETVAGAAELDRELANLANTLKTNATTAIIEHKDEIILLVNFITDTLIPAVASMASTLATVVEGWKAIGTAATDAADIMARALRLREDMSSATASDEQAAIDADADRAAFAGMGGGDVSQTGTRNIDPFSSILDQPEGGAGVPRRPGVTVPGLQYSGRGSAAGPSFDEILEEQVRRHQEEQAALRDHADAVVEIERGGASRVQEVRQQSAEELARIAQMERQARLQSVQGAFGDLSSLMQSENKKLFKIGQAAALAEATISGYEAAVSAWQKGMKIGGPPVAAAFTAASLAKTGMLISQISSASASGGGASSGGGGGSATSGASAGGAQAAPTTTFRFTLQNDPMGFGESFARQIVEQLNESNRNGSQVRGVIG